MITLSSEDHSSSGRPVRPLRRVEAEQLVLDRIRAAGDAGQSYNKIAAQLHAEAVPTKRGGRWAAATVRSVLRSQPGTPSRDEDSA